MGIDNIRELKPGDPEDWSTSVSSGDGSSSTNFPTASTVGLPSGWEPVTTLTGTALFATEEGGVYEDYLVTDELIQIRADNITLRRCKVVNGSIWNDIVGMVEGLVIEDCEVTADPAGEYPTGTSPSAAVGIGGFTMRNSKIVDTGEGFRLSGLTQGYGPTVIENCYIDCVGPAAPDDWHGDSMQAIDSPALHVINSVFKLGLDGAGTSGTSPFFWSDDQSGFLTVDGMIVQGGGYPFWCYTDASIEDLYIVEGSYEYQPYTVPTPVPTFTSWDVHFCTLDGNGQPIIGASIPQPT